jgi:hypothetical protein
MSLSIRISDLATRIGTEIKTMKTQYSGNNQGTLSLLTTTDKTSLLAAINEIVGVIEGLGFGDMLSTNNLSDVANAATALSNLGGLTQAQIDARVQLVVDSAPAALDTLNELAAALGDDANFAATMTTALSGKEPVIPTKYSAFNKNFGTAAGTVSEGNHTHAFSAITGKPTTLSGYGITDAALSSHNHTGVYEPANANIQTHISDTNKHIDWTNASVGFKTSGSITIDAPGSAEIYLDGNAEGNNKRVHFLTNGSELGYVGFPVSSVDLILNVNAFNVLRLKPTGVIQAHNYGSGNETGTKAYYAVFDSSGNFIEQSTIPFSDVSGRPTTLAGYGITDAAASSHTHTFASLTSKPTTLSGFGITDAYTKTEIGTPETNFVTVFETALA